MDITMRKSAKPARAPYRTEPGHNKVELLASGIICVEKAGPQNKETLGELGAALDAMIDKLRARGQKVLILVDGRQEQDMDMDGWEKAYRIGLTLDFDRSAIFGNSLKVRRKRQYISQETGLSDRVATFETREEAIAWLLR